MTAPHLASWTRDASLGALTDTQTFDVLVVGGGVIGSAVALDAASRGMRVALVEQNDFASGTSSRSTKLIHGGIRYLPHFEFGLVREGLLEQKVLVRTADFLYQPLDFIIPLYRDKGLADLPDWASIPAMLPAALRAGLWLYDALGNRPGPASRRVGTDELLQMVPTLRVEDSKGGLVYADAQTDDARLTLTVLKTAVIRHGAVAASRVRAAGVNRDGAGYVVELEDMVDGESFSVSTRSVVSATWAFAPPPIDGVGGEAVPVSLSKGVHLLFDPAEIGLGDAALVLPETDDGRVLFIVPWHGNALFGTTDTPHNGRPGEVRPEDEDVEYLLRHLHQYLDVGDVEPRAAFAGVRALVGSSVETGRASREHEIVSIAPGYVQVVGGKLTAYRAIAEEAADAVARFLEVDRASTTSTELLIGAGVGADAARNLGPRLAAYGLEQGYADQLVGRYGTEAVTILEVLESSPAARTPIGGAYATTAEVLYTAHAEGATTVADFALRRTHLAWITEDHGRGDAAAIAHALGSSLGWNPARREAETARYESDLIAEGL